MTRTLLPSGLLALVFLLSPLAARAETSATFTLDPLSFVSFEDSEVFPIPAGGTLRFRFGEPDAGGATPFTLAPADVSIPPIPLPDGKTLTYELASPASGTLTHASSPGDRDDLQFVATVRAHLSAPEGGGSMQYVMSFTTRTAGATNLTGTASVAVEGMPLSDAAGAMQLVGATISKEHAFPGPGKAVYTVLSGTFDPLPH